MKKIFYIIGSAGVPARYGGFETFAHQIALKLCEKYDVHIACSKLLYRSTERIQQDRSFNRFFIPLKANGLAGVIYDLLSLNYVSRHADREAIVMILGCGPGILLPFLPGIRKRMLLIHLDGLEWERAKWNYLVKLVLKMGWKLSVRYAKRLITDSLYVTNLIPIKHRPKAHLIRYGAEHLPTGSLAESPENSDYVLTIARAEPENKLELILKTVINDSAYTMVLISNAGHTRYGKKLIKKYGDHSRVKFVEAIYDNPALLQSYRFNCTLYIHGHSAGGTNPSLIEAMAAGIPVFAWDNPFNRETTYNMARYFHDRESLSRLIQEWSEQPDHDLGSRLRQITGESYQWDKVYEQLIEALK